MSSMLSFFLIWSPDPNIFPGLDVPRWYGFFFALGFIISQQIMFFVYRKEGLNERAVDKITLYLVIAVVVGARLGHCLFYDPGYYLSNPLEILKVWKGGLASHGGAIGMLVALWLFARDQKIKYLWILDRIAIVTCITGACIRMGNFMNSEILGMPTDSGFGVVFAKNVEDLLTYRSGENIEEVTFERGGRAVAEQPGHVPMKVIIKYKRGLAIDEIKTVDYLETSVKNAFINYKEASDHLYEDPDKPLIVDFYQLKRHYYAEIHTLGIARHPAQLYEAFYCLIMFFLFAHIWYYHRDKLNDGFIFGLFMMMLWSLRFLDEFVKENQEAWEADIPLNMGQWLSIPMFTIGLIVFIRALGPKKEVSKS